MAKLKVDVSRTREGYELRVRYRCKNLNEKRFDERAYLDTLSDENKLKLELRKYLNSDSLRDAPAPRKAKIDFDKSIKEKLIVEITDIVQRHITGMRIFKGTK